MPSAALLVIFLLLAFLATRAYFLSTWGPPMHKVFALIALTIGALGFCEGFLLAVREESRSRYGQVVPGFVVEKMVSDGGDRTGGRSWTRDGRVLRTGPGIDLLIYRRIARLMATGSARTLIVAYRYPCRTNLGTCLGRDYVGPALWATLRIGGTVSVRRVEGETGTARLDENPQWTVALGDMGIGVVLLTAAALLSGRLTPRRRRYLSASAVVTRVEQVTYGDAIRWKVRFAYFDSNGNAQDSADEVNQATWKAGDDCVAVYRPETPDLATLQPGVVHDQAPGVSSARRA